MMRLNFFFNFLISKIILYLYFIKIFDDIVKILVIKIVYKCSRTCLDDSYYYMTMYIIYKIDHIVKLLFLLQKCPRL